MSFSEWKEVKLGEIIEIEMGQSPKSEFYNQTGEGLPFLQGNRTFGDKYPYFDTYCTENKKIANTNDVIMSVRAPVGDLNIAQTKISLGRGVCAMRLKGEQNSNYLFYLMKHNIKEMINRESGTVFGSVNKKDILGLEVKITNNKLEQKTIVTGESIEYNSYVFSTYSSLKTANDSKDNYYHALITAYNSTMELIEKLKILLNNIKRYQKRLTDHKEVRELIREHFDDFKAGISDQIYHPLKTFDSVPRFKTPILKILNGWLMDDAIIEIIQKEGRRRGRFQEEAYPEVILMISEIIDIYEKLNESLDMIDAKHAAYTRAAVERVEYMINEDGSTRNLLFSMLQNIDRTEVDAFEIPLTSVMNLTEESLFVRKKQIAREPGEVLALQEPIDEGKLEQEMILLQQEQIKLEKMLLPLRTLRSLDSLSVENLVDYEDARTKQEKLERNLGQIRILQDTLEQLDLNAVVLLKKELENLVERQRTMQREIAGLEARQKQDHERITALQNREIPELKNRIHQTGSAYFTDYDHDYRAVVGEPRYEQEFKRLKSHEKIRDNFDQSYKTATNRKDAAFQNLVDERNAFEKNHRRDLGLMAKTNERYDALLDTLLGTELPAYMEKIEEAIQKAQAEFKDDFISKLKNNIDTVNRQIDALNASLKSIKFGKDTYRFNVRPNEYYKKYYDMIMDDMLLTGYNLFSVDFQTKYKEPLDELFKKIVDVGEGAITAAERAELEKNIEKYTDYRTYLDFDLIVTDEMGEKSRLSRMLNKKSGGETQTPFFISVLASFHRLYSLNDRRREDTMRLIIFDEAFSKMDHERIAESLKLLREMKFQTLISAPTEKIANIAPYVDKTLCVLRSERTTRVREWDKIVMEEV